MSGPGYACDACGMRVPGLRPADGLCGAYPTGTSIPEEKEEADVSSKEEREAVREALCGKTTATLIAEACDEIKAMLLKKNESYGDSALKPTRIFSRATTVQGLCTRIDDKLSRIMRGNTAIFAENDVDDLIGYLVLLRIAKKQEAEAPLDAGPALLALRTGGLSSQGAVTEEEVADKPSSFVCISDRKCPYQKSTDRKTPTGERVYLCESQNMMCDFCRKED